MKKQEEVQLSLKNKIKTIKKTSSKLEIMGEKIRLRKDNSIGNIITMFSAIDDAISTREVEYDGNKIKIRQKEEDEIFGFDKDELSQLKDKIFGDFIEDQSAFILTLTEEESDLFRKCSHAAYYFETERHKMKNEKLRAEFLDFHSKITKK